MERADRAVRIGLASALGLTVVFAVHVARGETEHNWAGNPWLAPRVAYDRANAEDAASCVRWRVFGREGRIVVPSRCAGMSGRGR